VNVGGHLLQAILAAACVVEMADGAPGRTGADSLVTLLSEAADVVDLARVGRRSWVIISAIILRNPCGTGYGS
jgi:hypothetical protein